MSIPPTFASVKLSSRLVDEARQAALPMRRSVAGQIEYWATLGRSLENAGLSAPESRALIAREEAVSYQVAPRLSPELSDLQSHVLALARSGALAQRAKQAVADNAAKAPATTPSRSRKGA